MEVNLTTLSEVEFYSLMYSRVKAGISNDKKFLSNKEFNFIVKPTDNLSAFPANVDILIIKDCVFNHEVILVDILKSGRVNFVDCIFNNNVIVDNTDYISFLENCVFNKNLEISIYSVENEVILANFVVNNRFTVKGNTKKRISIRNINIEQSIKEQEILIDIECDKLGVDSVCCKHFNLNGKLEKLSILSNIEASYFRIDKLVTNTPLVVERSNIDLLLIRELNDKIKKLIISKCHRIKELYLKLDQINNTDISNCTIDILQISGSNKNEDLVNVEKVSVKELVINKVYNNGLLTFRQLTIPEKGKVSIKSSNLGKTDFINCEFSKATLEFENNKIAELFFSQTDFPKKVELDNKVNESQAQLAFGQLATVFQKQGDTVRALEYQSREIEAHYNTIELFSADFFKKVNLWLNKISNNFGRYWMRGVIFSFGIGFLFFYFLLISSNKYSIGFPSFDDKLIPAYLKFMNPLRFIDTEALFKTNESDLKITLNGWSYFWDFVGRVFVAYGFFQTIQAFRRFGRK